MSQADEYLKRGARLKKSEEQQLEEMVADSENPLVQLLAFQVAGTPPFIWKLGDGKTQEESASHLEVSESSGEVVGRIKYRHIREGFVELTHFLPAVEDKVVLDELNSIRTELMWERMPK